MYWRKYIYILQKIKVINIISKTMDNESDGEQSDPHFFYQEFHFNQQNIQLVKPDLSNLPQQLKKLLQNPSKIKQSTLTKQFQLPPSKSVSKQVCARVFKPGDLLVECYQCRFDRTCVICLECFKNGNHDGHKYVVRQAGGGCCDCGDKEAWKVQGFCKNHSGKFKDFKIDQKTLNTSRQKLHPLFYLYFHTKITKKLTQLPQQIITHLVNLNKNNPYYNKITSICLCERLPFSLNPQLDKNTILQNILRFDISEILIDRWMELFMCLFGYYPFKLELLRCYIQGYGFLVNGSEQSYKCASSIACQILTSWQLIQKYSKQNKIALAENEPRVHLIQQSDIKKLRRYYFRLFNDINYLNNLTKQSAPLAYWHMHINSKFGVEGIFYYYEEVFKYGKKFQVDGKVNITHLVGIVEIGLIQQEAISAYSNILKIVKNQKVLLLSLLNFFFKKCIQYLQTQPNYICILRPYERCLGLTLFCIYNCNLQILQQHKPQIKQLYESCSNQSFEVFCSSILVRMLQSYLLYAKTIAVTGLGQSLYAYLYYYKIKYHLLSSVDIVCIKSFLLLHTNSDSIICIVLSSMASIEEYSNSVIYEKRVYLSSVLKFIKYLYVYRVSETHVSYEIDEGTVNYSEQISELLFGFFKENKNVVSLQKMTIFKNKLFSEKVAYVDQWLQTNCTINKDKKQFVLRQSIMSDPRLQVNMSDFWENALVEQISFADPHRTAAFILKDKCNLTIFNRIWTMNTLLKLSQSLFVLYLSNEQQDKQKNYKGIEIVIQNLLYVYLVKKQTQQFKQSQFIRDNILLKWVEKIPTNIRSKFPELNPNKGEQMQQETTTNNQSQKQKKRKRIQQLKMKKMQKMKQAQNKFLSQNLPEEEFPALVKRNTTKSTEMIPEQYLQEHVQQCCICRNDKIQQLYYLTRVEMSNHERMLNIGPGLDCISFHSCFHAFDKNCISSMFNAGNLHRSIQCPLCKTYSQLMIPIMVSSSNTNKIECDNIINRILGIIMINHKEQAYEDALEYVIKSFFHYVLMCYVDKKYHFHKNVGLYRSLWGMLVNFVKLEELEEHKNKILAKYTKQLSSYKKSMLKSELSDKKNIRRSRRRKLPNIQPQVVQQQQVKRYIPLFQITMQQFSHRIKQSQKYSEQVTKHKTESKLHQNKEIENQHPQLAQFVNVCFKILFQQPLSLQQKQLLNNFGLLKATRILKQLPNTYALIAYKQQCTECSDIRPIMNLCLFCHWIGCQNCKNGRLALHQQRKHGGGLGVFMEVQTAKAFYFSKLAGIGFIGQLYEDKWGNALYKNTKWEEFQLNRIMVEGIESTLINNKPINYKPQHYEFN